MRIARDDRGREYLEIDGKPSALVPPAFLASLGGMKRLNELGDEGIRQFNERRRQTVIKQASQPAFDRGLGDDATYLNGAGFGTMDPGERVELLDHEKIDKAILYPTLGLVWGAHVSDVELANAYAQAYNRWIADFCRDSGGRLIPIAHLVLADPQAAVRELERAVKDGCKGAWVYCYTVNRKSHGHPDHDPVFAAAQDLDVPLALHPSLDNPTWSVHHRFDDMNWSDWYFNASGVSAVQMALASIFAYGVFDRFPLLRLVILESSAGWIGSWLDWTDALYRGTTAGGSVRLKERPSYYFKRQCFISADPFERCVAPLTRLVGEDKFFWASDYPHSNHPATYIEDLKGLVAGMEDSARRGILGENAARVYKLSR
jgi:predicted TIM-barrel fold metal-dependent hydrolase